MPPNVLALQIAAKPLQIVSDIETYQRPIWRYHGRAPMTYRLTTVHTLQTIDDKQTTTGEQGRNFRPKVEIPIFLFRAIFVGKPGCLPAFSPA